MNKHTQLHTALCSENNYLVSALCFQLPTDGTVPDWVQLLPVGDVVGRDGRAWINNEPNAVIERTLLTGRDVPMDWEHSTELKAPKGEQAPAAAWLKEYKIENGFIWGRVEWNEAGRLSVAGKEVRYISPVFRHTSDGAIWDITSAALTNRANLYLSALNHQQNKPAPEATMNLEQLMAALRAKLNLPADATPEVALNSIQTLQGNLQTATNAAQTPSLEKFVPRTDYDQVLQRASNAENGLAEKLKGEKELAINTAVDAAITACKIAPHSKDYHIAACHQEGGLAAFAKFVEAAQPITGASGLDGKKPDTHTVLNAEQKQMADVFGNSEEDIKKYAGA